MAERRGRSSASPGRPQCSRRGSLPARQTADPRDRPPLCATPACCCSTSRRALRYLEKRALAELLRKLKEEGVSILLVEHDMTSSWTGGSLTVMDFGQQMPRACRRSATQPEGAGGVPGGVE